MALSYININAGKWKLFVARRLVRGIPVKFAESPVEFDREQWNVHVVQASDDGRVCPSHRNWINIQSNVLYGGLTRS